MTYVPNKWITYVLTIFFFLGFSFSGYSSFCSKHMYFPSNTSQKPQQNTTISCLPSFLWETTPWLNPFKCLGQTHVNGWSYFNTSQKTVEILLMLSSLIVQEFYNGVVSYLIGGKNLKNTSLIDDLKLKGIKPIFILTFSRNSHFGP